MPGPDATRSRRRLIRLSILAGVVVVFFGGLYAMFLFQSGRNQVQTQEIIAKAQQAFDQDDYAQVIELLEQPNSPRATISDIRDDPEALNLYVQARRKTPLPGGEHLRRIIPPLQQIVRLQPENIDQRNDLLGLLLLLDRPNDARQLAQDLSEQFPEDAAIARYLGEAQVELGQAKKALKSFTRAGQLEPLHVKTQIAIITLIQSSGDDIQPFRDRAQQLLTQHPEDPRAQMIRAMAYLAQDKLDQASELMRAATKRPPPNDDFIPILIDWLDRLNLYGESTAYLSQLKDKPTTSYAWREAIYRAYDAGDLQGALDRLEQASPQHVNADLLAIWLIASDTNNDADRVEQLSRELKGRNDPLAKAWADVLPLLLTQDSNPGQRIDMLTNVIHRDANEPAGVAVQHHPYLHQLLGEAYLSVQEPQAAVQAMQIAAANRSSWSRPHYKLAQTYLELGNPIEAYQYAEQAWHRQPNASTAALVVTARLSATNPLDADDVNHALKQAETILQQIPDHREVLPATLSLLARAGRAQEARQRIEAALESDPPVSAHMLNTLAGLSARYQLGLEQAIHETMTTHHGEQAQGLLRRARQLASSGKPDQGRSLLEQAMPRPADVSWKVALASYLSEVGSSDAASYWIALADDYSENLQIQRDALNTPGVRQDRAFTQRVIERLRSLAGEQSVAWRVETARLKMQDNPTAADLQQALTHLRQAEQAAPNRLDTQIELTNCLLLLGNPQAAEQSARLAKNHSPHLPIVQHRLGRVLHQLGRFEQALIELSAVASNPVAEQSLRLNACVLLLEQGEPRIVRTHLVAMRKAGTAQTPALLLLARLYAMSEQFALADEICNELLKSPDLPVISFTASYYEQTGRRAAADQVRAMAQGANISPADRLLLDAEGAQRRGERAEALTYLEQSAELEPTDPDRWRRAVAAAMMLSQDERATALAKRGLSEAGSDAGLLAVINHQALIALIKQDRGLIPLALAILNSAELRPIAIDALRVIKSGGQPGQVANKLADLAQETIHFQALHELAGNRLIDAGLNQRAFDLASTAATRFPRSAVSARIATLAAYRLKDWRALYDTAKTWGQRHPSDRASADLMLAAAQDALGRHEDATQTLEPYAGELEGGPESHPEFYELYTRALVRSDQPDQAWKIIVPFLSTSQSVRLLALRRIADDLKTIQTTTYWLEAITAVESQDNEEQLARIQASFMAGLRLEDRNLQQTAQSMADRLLGQPGPHSAEVYYVHGQIARDLGDLALAEESFRKVLKAAPDSAPVLNSLAMVLADRGGSGLAEAEELALRAIELLSSDPNLLDTLAIVRLKRGRLGPAEEAIRQAIRMQPDHAAWHLTYADILEAQGKTQQAQTIRDRYSSASAD